VQEIERLAAPKGRYCQRYWGHADVSPVWSGMEFRS
jgi:hypothetical protein